MVRHLREFLVVAEELHFGRAAESLGVAQPVLSRRIRRLEDEFGTELFRRGSRGVELTEAGRLLTEDAPALLTGFDRTRRLINRIGSGSRRPIVVGVPAELPARTIGALLRACARRLPELTVEPVLAGATPQTALLDDGALDVALLTGPIDDPQLHSGVPLDQEWGAVLPSAADAAAGLDPIELRHLSGSGLIVSSNPASFGWHERILADCAAEGFAPAVVHRAETPQLAIGMVLAGRGVTFLPAAVVEREPRVIWRPLRDRPLLCRWAVGWPRRRSHPDAHLVAELLTDVVRDHLTAERPRQSARPDRLRPWTAVYGTAATLRGLPDSGGLGVLI
ncbi:LysR family transcriptional regulator [Actinoalloteichus hymeniacidonis]|uniref:Transcriptional regulator n=1 Tax=Actinoalloteichus hymeniacidonis TaxID=340345 RepID=A0AAC9HUY9_9PSEU|nr:LysR family transcriptional regulator [Actinoalloteichus hymeniacidonis]AOS66094.1 transcriptional regulator [Actinoalloteichus hymeniacidonis]